MTYTVQKQNSEDSGTVHLKVGFGEPASNERIVKDAMKALEEANLLGGRLVLVNGPASLPVACVLAHYLAHRFGAVAVYDPKLGSYVVSITHDPEYPLGALIPA